MTPIAIVGSGGFAREVLCLIQDINQQTHEYEILGFIDGSIPKGQLINGYPIIGSDDDYVNEKIAVVFAFGDPHLKEKVSNKYKNGNVTFPTLIHPSVLIGDKKFVEYGNGCIICAGNILTTNIKLGDFVTLNLMCTVGHDTVIGNYSSFMPSVNISGEVILGNNVYCGTGAKIINQTIIGKNTIVGAGAVVTKNLPVDCTAVGVPAKPIKFNK